MFFKHIEIVGFKSFATKTKIEFLPGVTSVVGPNGSGKSNILDAIKWVLGDMSARSMRGKKMQDVIFAGSATFKPLGMAQVTLTVDNSRRILDMDFDEVQVTRRLFRTGESEYLINKIPCRRRDIHNLFLGTGIGASAYSILEQGKVDQIIQAKPIDRRAIIEEAAGISKYRERKAEALRKLDRTTADLKRLNDIIVEIERQVNSLKRQASKAERYRTISAELKQTEMELMVVRSRGLREQLAERQEEIRELQARVETLRKRHAETAEAEAEASRQGESIDRRLSEKNRAHLEISHKVKDLEHETQRHRDRIDTAENRKEQLAEELEKVRGREEELARRLSEVSEEFSRAETELRESESRYEELGRRYAELSAEMDERKRTLDALGREIAEHRDALSRCENDVRTSEALIARYEEDRTRAGAEVERLQSLARTHDERREAFARELEQAAAELEEKRRSISALQIRHAETHSRIAELTERLEAARRDLHQRQSRLSTLLELKSSFEGFFQGVRETMKAAGAGELEGVVGPLAGQVHVSREYETALEAALGAHVQDILVENAEAARRAMDYLMERELGRVTFWPLDRPPADAAPETLNEALARPGVVDHAPRLIRCDERCQPIVDSLLGRTVLVENFDAAETLSREFPSFDFLTLDGRLIQASGALAGGSVKSTNLLGREREIHELTEAVDELNETEANLGRELEEQRAAAADIGRELETSNAAQHETELRHGRLKKDHEAAERSAEETAENLRRHERQVVNIDEEIEKNRESIAQRSEEAEAHRAQLNEKTERLEAEREKARVKQGDYEERGSKLAQARVDMEKVRERLGHLKDRSEALTADAQALTRDRESLSAEFERQEAAVAESKQAIEGIASSLQELFEKRHLLENELSDDTAERDKLRMRCRELHNLLEQIQRDEHMVENDLTEKRVAFAEIQTHLNGLSESAREKFGRDLFEIASEHGEVERDQMTLASEVAQMREKIDRMGPVNLAALEEYEQQNERLTFLTAQRADLTESQSKLEESIKTIDETTKRLFHETFESVRAHFIEMFRRMFNGGKADLIVEQEGEDPLLDGGIEILAQPPGKKLQSLSLMSGGEKAMTAISLLFALFLHKASPFAVLDEIDAPLDDANVERFKNVVAEFAVDTQFIIITHNKQTMELADVIYGVTMEESGVSRLVSVRFDQAEEYITTTG